MMKLKLIAALWVMLSCLLLISCDENETLKPPSIISFSPESGVPGATVTITGANFSPVASDNVVTFNGVTAEVTSSTATSITTLVPENATTGKVQVTVKGKTATSASDFTILFLPAITSLEPASAYENETVTITGVNFSATPGENIVKFSGITPAGVTATVTNATATSLTITVPEGATTGPIKITVDGVSVTSDDNFTVLHPPVVHSFTPTSGLPATSTGYAGQTVTINGDHFSSVVDENIVTLNGLNATVLTASTSQLTFEVPIGATSGTIEVHVNNRGAASLTDFTVLPTNVWSLVNGTHDALLRSNGIAFVIGTKIYFGLGQNASNNNIKDFWEYDTETNTFTQRKNFGGVERNGATGFSIGSKGYVCGGYNTGTPLKDLWEYDPSTDTWTQRADFPGAARSSLTSFSIGDKGYVGTGYGSFTYYADLYEFDPAGGTNGSGSWLQKADVGTNPGGRVQAACFVIDSKGYIGGGSYVNSSNVNVNRHDFWEFASNTWTGTTEPDVPSFATTGYSFGIGSKGFVQISGTQLWRYNPSTNSWTRKADAPALLNGIGVNVGNVGYVITGSSTTRQFYRYIPD